MIAQLSTSGTIRQLSIVTLAIIVLQVGLLAAPKVAAQDWQNPTEVEQRIEPLSAIDQQFMAQQRAVVEELANRLGRRLHSGTDRDVDTLQQILDRGLVQQDDRLTLQAMGVVLGDLLAEDLDMEWVVYRDRAGRSRALRYRDLDFYLYPVTMISRRREAGNTRPVVSIYAEAVSAARAKLPGARWRDDVP